MEQILSILCSEANYYGAFQGHSLTFTIKGRKEIMTKEITTSLPLT